MITQFYPSFYLRCHFIFTVQNFASLQDEKGPTCQFVSRLNASRGWKRVLVSEIYYCNWEPENPADKNDVAIFDDKRYAKRVYYLRRQDAITMSKLFQDKFYYLQPNLHQKKVE